jgi:hypothetical protein
MDGSIYEQLFMRLGWVVGLLATIFVVGGFLVLISVSVHSVFAKTWWIIGLFASGAAWYLNSFAPFDSAGLERLFYLSVGLAGLSWIYGLAVFGLPLAYERLRGRPKPVWKAVFVDDHHQGEKYSHSFSFNEGEDLVAKVLNLERKRVRLGYKQGWLYHQCKDDPALLEIFHMLLDAGIILNEEEETSYSRSYDSGPRAKPAETFDPYKILAVDRSATATQIHAAFREQMKLYHPDRVNHLGAELKAVAEERSKAIQRAYEMLKVAV